MPTCAMCMYSTYIYDIFIYTERDASFNELLDDDLRTQAKRAKQLDGDDKMDDIVVPPRAPNQLRASMLPISLREKFGYLFSS